MVNRFAAPPAWLEKIQWHSHSSAAGDGYRRQRFPGNGGRHGYVTKVNCGRAQPAKQGRKLPSSLCLEPADPSGRRQYQFTIERLRLRDETRTIVRVQQQLTKESPSA